MDPYTRPDGFLLRPGAASDRAGLLDLIGLQHSPSDVPEAALIFDDASFGHDGWLVAVDEDRVVACLAPLSTQVRVGVTTVPGLEIEFVASHPDVEGRGLVRDLFRSMDQRYPDHLVRVMVGIPYFYRRLGYEYAIPIPSEHRFERHAQPSMPERWTVRELGETSKARLEAAQATMLAGADVTISHDTTRWRWLLASPNYTTILATDGSGEAFARIHPWEGDAYLFDVVANSRAGINALVAAAAEIVEGTVSVLSRPAIDRLLTDLGTSNTQDYSYYAQISDPVRFLDALRPTLSARLGSSQYAEASGDFVLSFYGSSVRIAYTEGAVGDVVVEGPVHSPAASGGVGVPPDHLAELVLGPSGVSALSMRHADVLVSPAVAPLAGVLFPPQAVDVQTWVYP